MTLFCGFLGSRPISLSVLFFAAVLLFIPLSLPTHVHSAQVTLAWDANTEPGVAGYKLYYGTSSRSYSNNVNAGDRTTWTVTNLQDNLTYYFAATAYNSGGEESPFSNEVVYQTSAPPSPACTYSISPNAQSISTSGGPGMVTVTTGSACPWTVVSNASWIIVTSNSSIKGTGTINYSVSANSGSSSRTGTLTIAGKTVTVSQSGASCSYSISPSSISLPASEHTGTVSVTAPAGCSWAASSNASWITVSSGISGSGNGNTGYSVAANSGSSSRNGSITIGGQTFMVSQSGSSAGGVVFAMNAGGSAYVDKAGVTYQADQFYNGGWTTSTSAGIAGTEDSPLYQTERFGNFSYSIPLASGSYQVLLRFTEFYWSSAGSRVFNVWMEGTKVISNLDIFAKVGKNRAYDVSLPVTVTDGKLDISFQAIADNGKLSAIQVTQAKPVGNVVFAENSGGPQYIQSDGTVYLADRYYSGGYTSATSAAISGTSNDPLYQTERFGNFSYSIPLPNGNYTVLLRFAEIYWSAPGQRIFDVFIEGAEVISNLDIFALVGKNTAYDLSIPATVTDGKLDIRFSTILDNAKVSVIMVQTR